MSRSTLDLPPEPDDVAQILQWAGPRAALPAAEVEPIKAAARQAWLASLAAPRVEDEARANVVPFPSRWTAPRLYAIAALVVAAVGAAVVLRTWTASPAATLELASGRVTVDGSAALTGARVRRGAVVETTGSGPAAIRLGDGTAVRLDAGSAVRFEGDGVELERGAVYVDTAGQARLAVETAFGTVYDVGTRFEVRLLEEGGLRVRVREGAIELDHRGRRLPAAAGNQLIVDSGGLVRSGAAMTFGGDWAWVEASATPIGIEGATLRTFLDWVGHETGRSWRFAESVEPAKADLVLHGSIAGLTPTDALDVVLPGCGLTYRLEGSWIAVEPRSELPTDAEGR